MKLCNFCLFAFFLVRHIYQESRTLREEVEIVDAVRDIRCHLTGKEQPDKENNNGKIIYLVQTMIYHYTKTQVFTE